MKLVINGNFLNRRISGVERYGIEISKRLLQKTDAKLISRPNSQNLMHLGLDREDKNLRLSTDFIDRYIKKGWVHLSLPRYLKKDEILWTPDNIGPIISNQVLTIHDMAVHDFPTAYGLKMRLAYKVLMPVQVRKCRAIITVSEFSKNRILSYFPEVEDKIRVIYNAVDLLREPFPLDEPEKILNKYGINRPYFLTLCTIERKKNIKRLIEAWLMLPNSMRENFQLVLVGGMANTFSKIDFDSIDLNNKNIVFTGYVEERHLIPVYTNSLCFVYPSLYEGFGLTVLEAASCGVPVLTSQGTAMEEIMGNSALYFDPVKTESICDQLIKLIEGEYDLEALRRSSLDRAAKYSWEKSATAHYNFFNEI